MKSKRFPPDDPYTCRLLPSVRLAISFVLFCGFFGAFINVFTLSLALPCMINSTQPAQPSKLATLSLPKSIVGILRPLRDSNSRASIGRCSANVTDAEDNGYHGTIHWTEGQQSMVMSGLGYGGLIGIALGGNLMDRFGVRRMYISGLLLTALTTAIIPILAPIGWPYVMAIRVIQGLLQVLGFPAMVIITNTWFPHPERGLLMSLGVSATSIAGLFTFGTGGYFCSNPTLGWQGFLYMAAGLTAAASLVFALIYRDNVQDHPWISKQEAYYIQKHTEVSKMADKTIIKPMATPWRSIFTSLPVWAIVIVFFSQYYMFYFISYYVMIYFKQVLRIGPSISGIFSAIPMAIQAVGRLLAGPISDALEKRTTASISIRILSVVSGHFTAILIFCVTLFDCYTYPGAVVFISLAYFTHGFMVGSIIKSISYIAPLYAGTVTGIGAEFDYASGIVVPYITAALISGNSESAWNHAFYATTAVGLIGSTFFTLCCSGELQSWSVLAQTNPTINIAVITNDDSMIDDELRSDIYRIRKESLSSEIGYV